jgi:adenylylsulfate kinase
VNIFPTDQLLQRKDKERLLKQKGIAIWLTGLSGAGKTSIAIGLEKWFHEKGMLTQVLDADNIREGLNSDLGFSDADRTENIRRISEVAKLFVNNGFITICCFVSPTAHIRNIAKKIIGNEDFLEVFVNTPLEVCEKRDVKGLYARARKGEIKDFTGIDSPFETPTDPHIQLDTNDKSVEDCVKLIIDKLPALRH